MVEVREVAFGSPEYHSTIELRREILRKPLGIDFTDAQLLEEANQLHIAAFAGSAVVGCLVLAPRGSSDIQMRQVAVATDHQRQGIGQRMVLASQSFAHRLGFEKMVLHARDSAVPFYLALGYTKEGAAFEEVGLPHFYMWKKLADVAR